VVDQPAEQPVDRAVGRAALSPPAAVASHRAKRSRRVLGVAAGVLVAAVALSALDRVRQRIVGGAIATGAIESAGPVATPAATSTTIGWVDVPADETLVAPQLKLSGWALDPAGIRSVEIRVGGRRYPATYGIARADVAAVRPGYPDNPASGFEAAIDVGALMATVANARQLLEVVATNNAGVATLLARKSVVPAAEASAWRSLHDAEGGGDPDRFYVLPGVSGIGLNGAQELDQAYASYLSPPFAVGMRGPLLYLRTTRGAANDWRFDPDWDIERRCGARRIAEDSLSTLLDYARTHRLPLLVTLNGGIWSDASCGVPEWDVTDHLEEERNNCQWNQANEVMPDDYLKHLPGSQESPELGRSLTFNVYARQNRHYKKRNLQAAGTIIAAFARAYPELFVGINLDPDNVLNPFFEEKQWYDYNPGTLRQFRHWLAGTGPYAGHGGPEIPDLRRYRRADPLSLAEVNRLSGQAWRRWDAVDPPRSFPRAGRVFWDDRWTHEWERFRRHLVALHYDELAQWLVDSGIPADRIYTSQGFMGPGADAMPFALRLDSPSKNFDSGGISVEGAVPRLGHLGATVYGPAAANEIRMETADSLYAAFLRFGPGWGIVEFNTTDLRNPDLLPDYAHAYRAFRDAFNFGARFVSPMAWNGSNGIYAGKPGYVAYTAWRNTPFEDAMRDFAVSHAHVPRGARLWTFGSPTIVSDDGWVAEAPASLTAGPGRIEVRTPGPPARLVSPAPLAVAGGSVDRLVLGVEPRALRRIEVEGRGASGGWASLGPPVDERGWTAGAAGVIVPLVFPAGLSGIEALRIALTPRAVGDPIVVRHLALYPPGSGQRSPASETAAR
jgi:hypothetical protein